TVNDHRFRDEAGLVGGEAFLAFPLDGLAWPVIGLDLLGEGLEGRAIDVNRPLVRGRLEANGPGDRRADDPAFFFIEFDRPGRGAHREPAPSERSRLIEIILEAGLLDAR